jgi:hypothetical protein
MPAPPLTADKLTMNKRRLTVGDAVLIVRGRIGLAWRPLVRPNQ